MFFKNANILNSNLENIENFILPDRSQIFSFRNPLLPLVPTYEPGYRGM
jgi:hypothetical protein